MVHLIKLFIRNFGRQKFVSLINIFGLSLGIAVMTIIGLWGIHELQFDDFHENKDRIYRVLTKYDAGLYSGIQRPLGQIAKEQLPAIEDMCRILFRNQSVRIDDKWSSMTGTSILLCDTNFFSFFSFPLKTGDRETVFLYRDNVIILESAVAKYFSDNNPIGKTVHFNGVDFQVKGIMKDLPNSSIKADFIMPLHGWYENEGWYDDGDFMTFFLLKEKTNVNIMEKSLTEILHKNCAEHKNDGTILNLEHLSDLHFGVGILLDNNVIKRDKYQIIILLLLSLIIIIVSCINFANMHISIAFKRAKHIGIKKVFGVKRIILISELYLETVCYVLLSMFFGLLFFILILPVFNSLTYSNLVVNYLSLEFCFVIVAVFTITILLSGSYPALYMARLNVFEILSGKLKNKQISFFQKSLYIFQYTSSIILLIIILILQKQIDKMISHDSGFTKKNIVYMKLAPFDRIFREELLKYPNIEDITCKTSFLTDWVEGGYFKKSADGEAVLTEICRVGYNYFNFFNINLKDGENIINRYQTETNNVNNIIVNESAVKSLKLDSPINHIIYRAENEYTIKGIVSDINTRSLYQKVTPQVFIYGADSGWGTVFFKIQGDTKAAINTIREIWEKHINSLAPGYPFEYGFLDEAYRQLYKNENNTKKIFFFSMFIVFILTIGNLFAMAYYATQRRIREVALRKIHGASLKDLFLLLNRDFLLLTGISFVVACPSAYLGLQSWLENFVVRTSLSFHVFLLAGVIAVAVTLLTTGFQTWKVAVMNPVTAIKTE